MNEQKIDFGGESKTYAELNIGGEKVNTLTFEQRAPNKGRSNNSLFTIQTSQQGICEFSTGISHGKRSRTSTIFSFDNLITTKLNPMNQLVISLALDTFTVLTLGE
jgi:hypothetical protein